MNLENVMKISWGPHTEVTKFGLNDPLSSFSTIFWNLSYFSTIQGLNYGACYYTAQYYRYIMFNDMSTFYIIYVNLFAAMVYIVRTAQ